MSTHHGEFKVPGGKLVVADLEVTDGALSGVSISGDFFLEPDEALDAINSALLGSLADSPSSALTARVHDALPVNTQLFGITPEGVATAVRRALGLASTWWDHEWEVIPPSILPTEVNVALDEVLTRAVGDGEHRPALRFWDWAETAVVIGSFQSYRNELDPDGVAKHHVNVVRRVSGGGAMFMEGGNCITYSLYLPQSLVDGQSFEASYAFLDAWVLEALDRVGVQARYVPLNDIATDQGKIGGAAQKRLANGGMLHHVTMSYDIDADKMVEVLRIGREKLSDKGTRSAKKRVDPLKRQAGMDRLAIIDVMIQVFQERYGAARTRLTETELAAARDLATAKFSTEEWLHRVP
ncbi:MULTISPECIES: biotin/lipoate A/B protein ligase family protein [Arthrobacter]|uniref:Biotin/lipoate A/B protein ligase family protein n=2 Tax=Arthrobacter TaxID=1663 RepID=A0ABU9KI43_9MICC|nr:biotin/lipoate A/B protein ligase family protein [Arthrobacter sp. YJM1]MDP5225825.1 biotin/lipoate A/B protein ligase family protein [Arthrobacter sp. YJM1]